MPRWNFHHDYREVPRTSDGFFEVLQEGIREFYDVAPSQAISRLIPLQMACVPCRGCLVIKMVDLLVAFEYPSHILHDTNVAQLSSRVPELDHIFDCLQRVR